MITDDDIRAVIVALQTVPAVKDDPTEFLYAHLSQCVLSSVYSLGATAVAERNVVQNYSAWAHLMPLYRLGRQHYLSKKRQEPLPLFLSYIDNMGPFRFASDVLQNRQRTSPSHGILKAECVRQFALVLVRWGIRYFQDLPVVIGDAAFEQEVKRIPGLRPGTGLIYFYMLTGDELRVKADRHVQRFLSRVCGRRLNQKAIQALITEVAKYVLLSPRQIDNMLWAYERARDPT